MIQGIIHLLINDTAVQQIVGKNKGNNKYKVYPVVAYQEEVEQGKPFIVCAISDNKPTEGRCVSEKDYQDFDLYIYAEDYETIDSLSKAARLAIDGYKGIVNGVNLDSVRFKTWRDDFDSDAQLYLRVSTYLGVEVRKLN